MLRLLLHLSQWKVMLWGKKEKREDGKITQRERRSKREREGVGRGEALENRGLG